MDKLSKIVSSKYFRLTVIAGVSLTAAGVLYSYIRRKRSVVQDITKSHQLLAHPRTGLKERLKRLLRKDNVFCKDMEAVEEVIDNLIIGGPHELQVIADFDHTMSATTHGGQPVLSCHGIIEHCPGLPDWFMSELDKVKTYYVAIEFDPNLTKEMKIPFMEEWWNKSHKLLISASLNKSNFAEAIRNSNLYLREKCAEVMQLLHTQHIPLLVFSAGIGDIIEQVFIQRYKLYDNIHIISNWMEFNHEGTLIGFKGENIHTFNKDTHALQNTAYFDEIRQRHNIILLGDSLGDLDIVDGLTKYDNLLTIGFLNKQVEASLPTYKDRFDIVLTNEGSMELLKLLLENITVN